MRKVDICREDTEMKQSNRLLAVVIVSLGFDSCVPSVAYDLALVLRLFRLSLLTLFFLHLALIFAQVWMIE